MYKTIVSKKVITIHQAYLDKNPLLNLWSFEKKSNVFSDWAANNDVPLKKIKIKKFFALAEGLEELSLNSNAIPHLGIRNWMI